jgi:hypothetical protein
LSEFAVFSRPPVRKKIGASFVTLHTKRMSANWRKLKDAEIAMLRKRRDEVAPSAMDWRQLRVLFEQCKMAPDANDAICFHGVAALLAEFDGDYQLALEHRRIEIDKITWLHQEEKRNPTNGFQTQDYEDTDLAVRRQIMAELQSRL